MKEAFSEPTIQEAYTTQEKDHLVLVLDSEASCKGLLGYAQQQKVSLKDFKGKALSTVGSKDGVLNQSSYEKAKTYLPQQTINVVLDAVNMPGLVAMVPKKATAKQTSQMRNNKKKSPQNSSSGSKLPKSKKELLPKSSFLFNLENVVILIEFNFIQ